MLCRAALLGSIAATLAACGGSGDSSSTSSSSSGAGGHSVARAPVTLASGDVTLQIDIDAKDIALVRGGTTLVHFPADGLELGTIPAVDDATDYDPMVFYDPTALMPAPDGVAWLAVDTLSVTEKASDHVALAVGFDQKKTGTLLLQATKPGAFQLTLKPDDAGPAVAYLRLRSRSDAKEAFYGLGEYFDHVNHRGRVRAMQFRVDSSIESGYNEAHVPVPFVIGTTGWGMFVESNRVGAFNVAPGDNPDLADAQASDKDLVEATFGTGTASKDGLVFHLFGEAHPLDVTKHYYDVTGYPRLPARWALGPWVWRDENKDQTQAEGDLQTMRDLDLAATGYWFDRPYATGVNTFDFNLTQFPDAAAMIGKLHDLGFRAAIWHTPYLDESDPAVKTLFDEATSKGYYPKVTSLSLNKWGKPIDFTNSDAYAFWQSHINLYAAMGIEGFKMDYGEDIVPGLTSARNTWEFFDGSDERTMHMGYTRLYHKVYDETLPADGGFLLCRHAVFGDQTHASVIWPGDLDSSFAHHRDARPGEDTTAVGGLPASVVAGLSLGPSGFPFFGADTGGYRGGPPNKELFSRWFEQTALSAVMEIGNDASTVAWEMPDGKGYDMEMLGWYRTYTRLHLRLFPYEWTYAQNLAKDGRPIARPLGLAYPELGQHPDDEYLFGDSLLVAPVVTEGATTRTVIFPEGTWIDWWDGTVYEGNKTVEVDAPLGKLPLFVLAGGLVPLLRPTIDTTAPTTLPDQVDSYATSPGVLYARFSPGPKSSFTLFDGALVGQELSGKTLSLSAADGSEFKLGVLFEAIAAGGEPTAVTEGGAALAKQPDLASLEKAASGWAYSSDAGGTLWVKTASGSRSVSISLP